MCTHTPTHTPTRPPPRATHAHAQGIVVMGATNRKDVLDAALTRPGRFDRSIEVRRPDFKGRLEAVKVRRGGVVWGVQVCGDQSLIEVPAGLQGPLSWCGGLAARVPGSATRCAFSSSLPNPPNQPPGAAHPHPPPVGTGSAPPPPKLFHDDPQPSTPPGDRVLQGHCLWPRPHLRDQPAAPFLALALNPEPPSPPGCVPWPWPLAPQVHLRDKPIAADIDYVALVRAGEGRGRGRGNGQRRGCLGRQQGRGATFLSFCIGRASRGGEGHARRAKATGRAEQRGVCNCATERCTWL